MAEKVQLTGIVKQKVVEKDTTAGSEYNTYIPEDRQLVVVKDGDTYTIVIGDGNKAVKDCAAVGGSGGSEYRYLEFINNNHRLTGDGSEDYSAYNEELVSYGANSEGNEYQALVAIHDGAPINGETFIQLLNSYPFIDFEYDIADDIAREDHYNKIYVYNVPFKKLTPAELDDEDFYLYSGPYRFLSETGEGQSLGLLQPRTMYNHDIQYYSEGAEDYVSCDPNQGISFDYGYSEGSTRYTLKKIILHN